MDIDLIIESILIPSSIGPSLFVLVLKFLVLKFIIVCLKLSSETCYLLLAWFIYSEMTFTFSNLTPYKVILLQQ